MLERAVCRRWLLPAESWRSIPLDLPILEPLSAVSRMVAHVSHGLRLPLTAILANAEFLTQPNISELERNELYLEIRCSVDRMNELISSLLECSRGRDTLRPGARNIVDTVERAIRMTSVNRSSAASPSSIIMKGRPWVGSMPTASNGWSPILS
jgi:signal transduction histidine kinase